MKPVAAYHYPKRSITRIAMKRRTFRILGYRRARERSFANFMQQVPYNPPLTLLQRQQLFPEEDALSEASATAGAVLISSDASTGMGCLFADQGMPVPVSSLFVQQQKRTVTPGRESLWERLGFSLPRACAFIACVPKHLRQSLLRMACTLVDKKPAILIGEGVEGNLLALWLANLLGVPGLIVDCESPAAVAGHSDLPIWFKEQLILLLQKKHAVYVAKQGQAFQTLAALIPAEDERRRLDSAPGRRFLINGKEDASAAVTTLVNGAFPDASTPPRPKPAKIFEIAVMPDDRQSHDRAKRDSFSYDAINYFLEQGHKVRLVDVYSPDILEQIRGCDGFFWRWGHMRGQYHIALKLFPVVEKVLGIPCLPDWNTAWHYDDKAAQAFLFEAMDIPGPRTWIFHDKFTAHQFLRNKATYPLVLKLASGAGSTNVLLVGNADEAVDWADIMFDQGVFELAKWNGNLAKLLYRGAKYCRFLHARGFPPVPDGRLYTFHRGYILFQEFLPDNGFDTRISVIGDRLVGFRRFNRPHDFRSSGSGLIDYDQTAIDHKFLHLAADTARKLKTQSIAIDGLYRNGEAVLGEISYTYVAFCLHETGGYWKLEGEPHTGSFTFVPEPVWPGRALAEDFLHRLRSRDQPRL